MSPPYLDSTRRIWSQIAANAPDIDDLFERIIQSFYSKVVSPGDTAVDGGAHTGRHTIPLARLVGNDGLVVAFEPLQVPASKLRQLLGISGLDQRVRLRSEALANKQGKHDFFIVQNMPEYSGLSSRDYVGFVPEQTTVQVDLETIDLAVNTDLRADRLSFIKLDLEGGEFNALKGAERTLRAHGPCCVFENGLESSASGYDADEFFGYFKSIEYELYDILGCRVDEALWNQPGPWYFVAMPRVRSVELLPLLWMSALEELVTSPWVPREQGIVAAAAFRPRADSIGPALVGHVDRVDRFVRLSGWAADPESGRPARSLLVTVDGTIVAVRHQPRQRHDVTAATGLAGLADSGFDVVLRGTGERIEVYAEASDGTFVKLVGGP
jgi:FkbM family methyltransferase